MLVTSYSYFEGESAAQVAHPPVLGLGLGLGLGRGEGEGEGHGLLWAHGLLRAHGVQVADRRFLCGHSWGVVVFDEAHALKDRRSSRFKRLGRLQANPNPNPHPHPDPNPNPNQAPAREGPNSPSTGRRTRMAARTRKHPGNTLPLTWHPEPYTPKLHPNFTPPTLPLTLHP